MYIYIFQLQSTLDVGSSFENIVLSLNYNTLLTISQANCMRFILNTYQVMCQLQSIKVLSISLLSILLTLVRDTEQKQSINTLLITCLQIDYIEQCFLIGGMGKCPFHHILCFDLQACHFGFEPNTYKKDILYCYIRTISC